MYPIPLAEMLLVKDKMINLRVARIIFDSDSLWVSTVLVVRKKNGGQCMVIDYRSPSRVTSVRKYPLPLTEHFWGLSRSSVLYMWSYYGSPSYKHKERGLNQDYFHHIWNS